MPSRVLAPARLLLSGLAMTLLCLALLAAALTPAQAAAPAQTEPLLLRIGVSTDGIVRITPADIAAAGIDPALLDPRTFALSSQDQPAALHLTGSEDGRFDGADALFFFGQRLRGDEMTTKYSDENVYWLRSGGDPGPRIPQRAVTPQGDLPPAPHFAASVQAEENMHWYTQHTILPPTRDTWFWAEFFPTPTRPEQRDFTGQAPHPAPDQDATLWIDQNARALNTHITEISLNHSLLLTTTWDLKTRNWASVAVPAGLLASGVNTVTVRALAAAGVRKDWVYFNFWRLDYRRLFRAWQGQIDFRTETAGLQAFAITDWAGTDIFAWEISDPLAPRRLTGAAIDAAPGGFRLLMHLNAGEGEHFWLQEASAIGPPASLRRHTAPDLQNRASGADVIIITAAALQPAAERLAEWQRSQGHTPLVLDFLDVVDAFNAGIYHPQAVPALLAWAQAHWPEPKPAYLILFGDGHWNFKGYNPALYPPEPNHIPPYLAWVDPWQGEVPADNLYADLDGDRRPDLAIGRIPALTLAEAETMVDKISGYDSSARLAPWQRRAVFVADNADAAGDFPLVSDAVIAQHLPADLTPERIYLGGSAPDAAAARAAIAAAFDAGAFMLQYTGHGSVQNWAHESIWTAADVAGLQNAGRLPLIMTFNCLDGYFAFPGQPGMAESVTRQQAGGAIAAISPTGLGTTGFQHEFRLLLMDALFAADVADVGEALLLAKQRFFDRYGANYLVETMTLFGDPTLRLPRGQSWAYLPLFHR